MKTLVRIMLVMGLVFMACPTEANAQKWLQKLSKGLEKLGGGTATTRTNATTSSSTSGTSTAKYSAITPKISDCWRQGNYVWIAVTLTNNTANDKTVEIYNEWEDHTTKVFDEAGKAYNYGIIVNNAFKNLGVTSFISVDCPAGVPVKVYVVASGVPATTKSISRLRFTIEGAANNVSNIPITEPKPNTNGDNLTCSYPYINLKYLSCERGDEGVVLNFTMTSTLENGNTISWDTDKLKIYDGDGNTYGWTFNMSGLNSGNTGLPSEIPVAGKLTIKNVPASLKEFHTIKMPFRMKHGGQPFAYEVMMKNVEITEAAPQPQPEPAAAASAPKIKLGKNMLGEWNNNGNDTNIEMMLYNTLEPYQGEKGYGYIGVSIEYEPVYSLVFTSLEYKGSNILAKYIKLESYYTGDPDNLGGEDAGEWKTKRVGTGQLTLIPLGTGKVKVSSTESLIKNAVLYNRTSLKY